jgi:hypothetical protein
MAQQARRRIVHGRGWRPDVEARIVLDEGRLNAFCERWRVAMLELFGSILRDDFGPESDADLLVTFQPDADWGLLEHAAMEEELTGLLGRPVDLLTRRAVVRSANPIRRESILASATSLLSTTSSLAEAERVDT